MTGNQNDAFARIKGYLAHWFGQDSGPTPILDALLQGYAWAISFGYSLYAYAKLQTRILTATDGWLDLIAADFFGTSLRRAANQSDASFRARIIGNMFRERATRHGIAKVITDLTGRAPNIFEPWRPADGGCMNAPQTAGYCGVARMGSIAVPFTAMIHVFRPNVTGGSLGGAYAATPQLSALNNPLSPSYTNSLTYTNSDATDADIYAAIDAAKPVGTIMWVAIT